MVLAKTASRFIFAASVAWVAAPAAAAADDPRAVLNAAKASAADIHGQAVQLTLLAWPAAGTGEPLVQAAARRELVEFGTHGFAALRQAIPRVDPRYTGDLVATMIEARLDDAHGSPPDYLPGLEEGLWFGASEARRLAMAELSRYPFPPAVLTTIDAIHDEPRLTLAGIRALSRLRDERGRFFLIRVLDEGDPRFKQPAAQALGKLGEVGTAALREHARSPTPAVREAALAALLPHAGPDDLTLLHEYVMARRRPSALLEQVRARTAELEMALESEQLSDEASADPAIPSPRR